jgi:hypothetical protein
MKWLIADSTDINDKANKFSQSGKRWHFHILTPSCKLNRKKKYALILENSSDKETYVSYSDKPNMELGKKLLKILYGISLSETKTKKEVNEVILPPDMKVLIKRAKQLSSEGKFWHHHLLLPVCIFNNSNKYVIMLEDQENNKIIKAFSDNEPKASLQEIETLYYQQKELK